MEATCNTVRLRLLRNSFVPNLGLRNGTNIVGRWIRIETSCQNANKKMYGV